MKCTTQWIFYNWFVLFYKNCKFEKITWCCCYVTLLMLASLEIRNSKLKRTWLLIHDIQMRKKYLHYWFRRLRINSSKTWAAWKSTNQNSIKGKECPFLLSPWRDPSMIISVHIPENCLCTHFEVCILLMYNCKYEPLIYVLKHEMHIWLFLRMDTR